MDRVIIESDILDDYRRVMGEDGEAFVRDLVTAFIKDSNGLAETLELAWKDKDQGAFERAAHTFKTTSKTMGAIQLSRQFESLELKASMGDLQDEALYTETMASLDQARRELTKLYLQ
jgi:HPt (histidine-containing phosphotransfer) domain-containing protein